MTLQNRYISDTTRYSTKEIQQIMKPNTMYLMARNAGPGVDHYFYLYKNDKGEMYSISAFPENDMSKSPTATAENIANGGGGWGNIVSKVSKYNSNSPDAGNATFVQEFSSSTNNPQETAQAWQKVRRKYEVIQYANKPYRLVDQNSNSAANTVERDLRTAMTVENVNSQIMRRDITSPGINEYINTDYSGEKTSDKKSENSKSNDNNSVKWDNGSVQRTNSLSDEWQKTIAENVKILQNMNATGENPDVATWIKSSTDVLASLNSGEETPSQTEPKSTEPIKQAQV